MGNATATTIARNTVAAFGTVAEGDAISLVGAWNVGIEVRYWVDSKLGKLEDLATLVGELDEDGYAVRRGGSSKSTLSKYGKLCTAWESYDAMVEDIMATDGVTLSWDSAYQYACRKTASKRAPKLAEPTVSMAETVDVDQDDDDKPVGTVIGANVWEADARQLLALICQQYPTREARVGVVATLKALVDSGVTA